MALALAVVLLGPSQPTLGLASATTVTGPARVVDGDTLDIGGVRVRLEGIDAPESSQTCARRWIGRWRCGIVAANALERLIKGRVVTCEAATRDLYGRSLGICHAGDVEINAWMVNEGLAWAFVKYSVRYVETEAAARSARRGIWAADTEPAWVYRQQRWQVAEQAAPAGCAIKGNVSKTGRIYHMPWSPWYAKVKVDRAKGEAWFCSEAEASKAGFRPVVGH